MTTPLMSIIALYNWDSTIFDFFNVPKPLDKEELENNLMMELGELSVIYSEPTFLKWAIGQWSNKQAPIWKRLYDTTLYEYNPIHNKDYTEYYDDTRNITRQQNGTENTKIDTTNDETQNTTYTSDTTRDLSGSNNETRDLTGTSKKDIQGAHSDTGTENNTNTRSVSAYNMENSFAPAEKTDEDKSHTFTTAINDTEEISTSDSGTVDHDIKEDETTNVSDKTGITANRTGSETGDTTTSNSEKSEDIFTHRYHGEGNIGVTTTQSMINEQREVVKFNIYDYIIEEFKQRFCIMVY